MRSHWLFVCLACVCSAVPVPKAPALLTRSSTTHLQRVTTRQTRSHFVGKGSDGKQFQVLVDDKGTHKVVTVMGVSGPETSQSVVEGRTANQVLKLDATFATGKRLFLVPSLNTMIMASSTVATDSALKPPFAVVMKPKLGGPYPKPLDPVVLSVQNYYTAMAGLLADFLDDNTVTEMASVKQPDDLKAVFATTEAVWPDLFARIKTDLTTQKASAGDKAPLYDEAISNVGLLPDTLKKATANVFKYANMVFRLDIKTCQFGTTAVDSLRGEVLAAKAFDAIKANAKPTGGTGGSLLQLDSLQDPPVFGDLTKDMQGWLKSGAKAGAKAMLDPFIGALDEEIKARKPPQGYLDFFVDKRVEYGLLGVEDGKVPLHHLNTVRESMNTKIRKQLEEDLVKVLFAYKPLREFIVGADQLQDTVKKDVVDWLKGVGEWLKQLVKLEKATADTKLKVAEAVKKGGAMDVGEGEIAAQMFQAAAMGRLKHCTDKIVESAKPVKNARATIKSKVEKQPGWTASNKFDFKPDLGFGTTPAEIIKGVGLSETFNWVKGASSHKLKIGADLKAPFDEKKNELKVKVEYEYKNGQGLHTGLSVSTTVVGIMKSPTVSAVTATGFVKYKSGGVQHAALITVNVDPTGKKPSVATFNYNLDIKFSESLSFFSRTTLSVRGGTAAGTTFQPSALAKFDQTFGLRWKVNPRLNLALTTNYGYEENSFNRGRFGLEADGHITNLGRNARLSWTANLGAGFNNDLSSGGNMGKPETAVMGFVGLKLTW